MEAPTPSVQPAPPKRRSRRSAASSAAGTEAAGPVEAAAETAAPAPAETAAAETAAAEAPAPAAPSRRRAPRRASEASAEAPPAEAATPTAPSASPDAPATGNAKAAAPRGRRRSATPTAEATTPEVRPEVTPEATPAVATEVALAATADTAAAPLPDAAAAQTDAPPAAPRRRNRRSAAQPATPATGAAEAPGMVEAPSDVISSVVADAAPAPETRQSTGRRRRGAQREAVAAATPQVDPAAAAPAPETAVPEAAPPASAAEATAVAALSSADEAPPMADTSADSPPAADTPPQEDSGNRRPRRRRGRGRGEAATTATASDAAAAGDGESPPEDLVIDRHEAVETGAGVEQEGEQVEAAAPPPAEPAPLLELADPARFACALPTDDPFGWQEVTDRRSGQVHRLRLRDLAGGDSHCDCEDFAADPQGRCPHLHSLLAQWLEARPELLTTLRQGERRAYSELHLRHGAQRQIVWRLGSEAAAELREAVGAASAHDGSLRLEDGEALQQLLRLAARQGHRVEVEEGVWALLGEQHDTRRRVLALEAAYPAGPTDAGLLQGLLRHPVAPHQLEAALLAACAGRCVLADEPGLGKVVQALATLALLRRHFGAERLLVAAPAGWLRRWQRAIARWTSFALRPGLEGLAADDAPLLRLISLDELRSQVDVLAAWAPDVLVIDEGLLDEPPWLGATGAALRRLDPGATLLLTRRPLQTRPQALPALLRWLDPLRLGPMRRLLEAHAPQPGEPGTPASAGWRDLDRLGETLLPLLLQRRRSDAALPAVALPGDDDVQTLPLDLAQRARHQAQRERAERLVARWERVGDLSSREQRELFVAVQGMRQACVVPADEAVTEAKTAALLSLMQELSPRVPEVRLVVFSQWPAALQGLARVLERQGIGHQVFDAGMDDAALADGAARFAQDPQPLVALVDDAVRPRLRLVHDLAGVVHLDRPWHPRRLAERLDCVQPALAEASAPPPADGVPVLHLIAEGSIEEALLDLQSAAAAQGDTPAMVALAERLDGPAGGAFLGGSALTAAVQQLRDVLRAV